MDIKINKFSLQWPKQQTFKVTKLNENTINDLSIEFLCEKLTNIDRQQTWIKEILINLSNSEEVINYSKFSYRN